MLTPRCVTAARVCLYQRREVIEKDPTALTGGAAAGEACGISQVFLPARPARVCRTCPRGTIAPEVVYAQPKLVGGNTLTGEHARCVMDRIGPSTPNAFGTPLGMFLGAFLFLGWLSLEWGCRPPRFALRLPWGITAEHS